MLNPDSGLVLLACACAWLGNPGQQDRGKNRPGTVSHFYMTGAGDLSSGEDVVTHAQLPTAPEVMPGGRAVCVGGGEGVASG